MSGLTQTKSMIFVCPLGKFRYCGIWVYTYANLFEYSNVLIDNHLGLLPLFYLFTPQKKPTVIAISNTVGFLSSLKRYMLFKFLKHLNCVY